MIKKNLYFSSSALLTWSKWFQLTHRHPGQSDLKSFSIIRNGCMGYIWNGKKLCIKLIIDNIYKNNNKNVKIFNLILKLLIKVWFIFLENRLKKNVFKRQTDWIWPVICILCLVNDRTWNKIWMIKLTLRMESWGQTRGWNVDKQGGESSQNKRSRITTKVRAEGCRLSEVIQWFMSERYFTFNTREIIWCQEY